MAHPLPPWPRRLVPEVFRCRLAQIRAFGRCKCAPSVLSPHLAVRWRRLSLTTCPIALLLSNEARHAFLGFLSPPMHRCRSYSRRCGCPPYLVTTDPNPLCRPDVQVAPTSPILQHVQGSPVARTPSSRLASSPARLVPSRRHPWGSTLQRFDFALSRTPFG